MNATAQRSTLVQLAATIQREDTLARMAGQSVIEHAVRCGEALLAAQEQVGWGQWGAWIAENFPRSEALAKNYMRLARHQEHLADADSITAGLRIVSELEPGAERPRPNPRPRSEIKQLVLALRARNYTHEQIAAELGITVRQSQFHSLDADAVSNQRRDERQRKRPARDRKSVQQKALSVLETATSDLTDLSGKAIDDDLRDVLTEAAGMVDQTREWLEDALASRSSE